MSSRIVNVALPNLTLIGLSDTFYALGSVKANGAQVIPGIWEKSMDATDELDNFEMGWAVGVMTPVVGPEAEPGKLNYFAGFAVESVPEYLGELSVLKLAASDYLVCEHIGDLDELPETTEWFYTEYLPTAGIQEKDAPHLEVYDERFDPESEDSVVMICVPKL